MMFQVTDHSIGMGLAAMAAFGALVLLWWWMDSRAVSSEEAELKRWTGELAMLSMPKHDGDTWDWPEGNLHEFLFDDQYPGDSTTPDQPDLATTPGPPSHATNRDPSLRAMTGLLTDPHLPCQPTTHALPLLFDSDFPADHPIHAQPAATDNPDKTRPLHLDDASRRKAYRPADMPFHVRSSADTPTHDCPVTDDEFIEAMRAQTDWFITAMSQEAPAFAG